MKAPLRRRRAILVLSTMTPALVLASPISSRIEAAAPPEQITYALHPPVGSSDPGRAQLNCGWHSSCTSPGYPAGLGLDWDDDEIPGTQSMSEPYGAGQGTCCLSNTQARNIYARAWVNRSQHNVTSDVMDIRTVTNDGACRQVEDRMTLWSAAGLGPYLGKEVWQHAIFGAATEWWSVQANKTGLYNRAKIGRMVGTRSEELATCQNFWFGVHVHEEHSPGVIGTWTQGSNIPNGNECNQGASTFCTIVYNNPGRQASKVQRQVVFTRVADPCEQAEVSDYCEGQIGTAPKMSLGDGDPQA